MPHISIHDASSEEYALINVREDHYPENNFYAKNFKLGNLDFTVFKPRS